MLFLHEVHSVQGARATDFEAAYRDGWMRLLASDGDARLLWYCNQAHGGGPAYTVVTITGVADAAAWQRLMDRVEGGDLRDWMAEVDDLRHDVSGKMLLPVSWSPLQSVDLRDVSTTPLDHAPTLYMEDTGWPYARLDAYIRFWDEGYHRRIEARPAEERLLEVEACFEVAHGSHRRPEAILMQRIVDQRRLLTLLTTPPAAWQSTSSPSYMTEALRYRDQWESRLLRTSRWSPRF
jgi:hypothetical protein